MGVKFITCSNTKDYYSFIGNMRSNVKRRSRSTESWWKVCDSEFIFILSSLCTNAPKTFLVLIGVWSNWCEEHFATYLLPQFLSGFNMKVEEFYTGSWFAIVYISRYCAGGNQEKSTEYMEVQILDSLSARMRQQPDDVGHLRCSPTKTLR